MLNVVSLKSISFRNGLFLIFVLVGLSVHAQNFDPFYYSTNFPGEDFICIKHDVDIEFNESEDGLTCETKHKKEYLTLVSDVSVFNRILLTFGGTQDLKVTSARFYEYIDGRKKLINNVKTKWLKERDHYIKGVFYNDAKDLEVYTNRRLKKHTHITIEYVVTDNDPRFINPIYVADYGEHVIDFNLSLKEPYDAIIEIVPFNTDNCEFEETKNGQKTEYEIKNLNAIRLNGNSPPYNYLAPHFVPVVRMIGDEPFLKSTEDLYRWYRGLIKEVEVNSSQIQELSASLIEGANSEAEKIEQIFTYVQNRIDYLAFEDGIAGFKPSNAEDVLKTGYGDCKGMSNLLVDLLKNAGIQAGHAWVGTRRLNYTYDLAALCVDNHMVCWVKHENEVYILDATGKGHLWNRMPSHLQGKQLLMGKGDDFEIIEIPILEANENLVKIDANIELSGNTISDKISGEVLIKGNDAIDYFMSIQGLSLQSEFRSGNWIISQFFNSNVDDIDVKDLNYSKENFELKLQFEGRIIGSKMKSGNEVSFYPKFSQDLIDISSKDQVIYFDNAFVFESNINFQLQNGMKVKDLPENIDFKDSEFSISYSLTDHGSSLTESRKIVVNTIYSDQEDSAQRENFMKNYYKSYKTPIKLTL